MDLSPILKRIAYVIFSSTLLLLNVLCEDDFKETPPEPQEVIIVGPSMVFEQLLPESVQKKLNKELNVQLRLISTNSVMAVETLLKYKASIAIIAEDFENITDVILEIKPDSMEPGDFDVTPFSTAHIAMMTHPMNPVKELTKEQTAKIFKGEITNWREVGGKDLPIAIYVEAGSVGIRTNFEESFLQPKDKITEKSYSVTVADGLTTGVREHEEAISYYLVLDCITKKGSKNSFLKGIHALKIKDKTNENHQLYLVVRHDIKDNYEKIIKKLHELAE